MVEAWKKLGKNLSVAMNLTKTETFVMPANLASEKLVHFMNADSVIFRKKEKKSFLNISVQRLFRRLKLEVTDVEKKKKEKKKKKKRKHKSSKSNESSDSE